MEGVILFIIALCGLGVFGVGVILLYLYWRSGRMGHDEPVVYGNLVQCPRCDYMNPVDSAVCLSCQFPLSHSRHTYQPPSSPTYPTLPPQYVQRPAPPPDAPAHYAQPPAGQNLPMPNAEQTVVQSHTPAVRIPPPTQRDSPVSASREMPRAWLEGESGVIAGQRTTLVQTDTLFGRSTQCDVQIYDPKVSRYHFVIRYGNGAFFLQDQGSSRGTLINGARVTAQRLNDGDRIELGDSCLIFHIEA